jgi:hypothetical protein
MKKIAYAKYGIFLLSDKAMFRYAELCGFNLVKDEETKNFYSEYVDPENLFSEDDIPRDSLKLIQVIEELDGEASDKYSCVDIVCIPVNAKWSVEERTDFKGEVIKYK